MKQIITIIILLNSIVGFSCTTFILKNGNQKIVTDTNYYLDDIKISVVQTKSYNAKHSCQSKISVYKNNKIINSLIYFPEAVGGNYGISTPQKIDNHLVFTKHGDYDGKTIIINQKGEIFEIKGGENFYDPKTKFLFTIYESDLRAFAVFDLKNDAIIYDLFELNDTPISFHKEFENQYFVSCLNDELELSIWEIEFELDRVMQVDLDSTIINSKNVLKTWDKEDVNCECIHNQTSQKSSVNLNSIWDLIDIKANEFKKDLSPQTDINKIPFNFELFYQAFISDSINQKNKIDFKNLLGVLGECDTTLIYTPQNWAYTDWNFIEFFPIDNNTNDFNGWNNSFYFSDKKFYYEFILKEVGTIYQVGFEKIKNKWMLTLYFVNAC